MKMKDFFTRRISSKLIVLLLMVSLIPVLIIGLVSYYSAKGTLENSIAETLTTATVSRAIHVEDLLTASLDIVASSASFPVFRDNLMNIEKGVDLKMSAVRIEGVLKTFNKTSNAFYRAKILNSKGIVVATTDNSASEKTGDDRSAKDYFIRGIKGSCFTEPYISETDKIVQIAYASPILNNAGVPIGVLVIHQALDGYINSSVNGLGLNEITNHVVGNVKSCETYLVNKDRFVITKIKSDTLVFMKYRVSDEIFQSISAGQVQLVPYKDYKGILCIGKAVSIAGCSWVMIGEFDQAEAFAPINYLRNEIILITLLIVVLVTLLAIFIARYFANPIVKLTAIAKSMASGALDQTFTISQNDEVGELAASFKAMQQSLQIKAEEAQEIADGNLTLDIQLLSDKDVMGRSFKTMVEKLRLQFNEISEGVNVLAASSSEIMASVSQLAASSAETATSVGETTTTIEEVKQTAEIANQKAKAVSENAVRTAEISNEGAKSIANTIEGMNRIRQQMNSIAGLVVRLSDQSQTIGEITASVNELAEQSNLLAVNAAIEAAKAGEQGKGFTVVAQEIKMLADRSKEATVQIRNILREIQKSISSAVMATEEGGKAVDEGLKLTIRSGDSIKTLAESVSQAAKAAIQIAASSQQQVEGMDQVVTAMENIKDASMQAAASTQQSADSVIELQKTGQKLDNLMKQYKLVK